MHSFDLFTEYNRIKYARLILCITLVVIFLISFQLWLTNRNYPLAPVFDGFPVFHGAVEYLFAVMLLSFPLFILIFRNSPFFTYALITLFIFMVLGDQNRLQPYLYQMLLMLLCIAVFSAKKFHRKNAFAIQCIRIILFGTYFWAGIHKINHHFIDRMYPFVAGNLLNLPVHFFEINYLKYFILVIPLSEILIALGLLFNRTRNSSVILLVFMHFAIILFLSPLGLNWNKIVIPWNLTLIGLNILVFWNAGKISLSRWLLPQGSFTKGLVMLLVFIMPVFNFWGKWDHYLSASLYSFKVPYPKLYVDQNLLPDLPPYIGQYLRKEGNAVFIDITYWSIGELKVMPYPEERVNEKIRKAVCGYAAEKPCLARIEYY